MLELQNIIYSTKMLYEDIIEKSRILENIRNTNYNYITKMRDYEKQEYTVNDSTLKALLDTEQDIDKKQKDILEQLLQTKLAMENIKNEIKDLNNKYNNLNKPKSIVTRRMNVWIQDT